jgi:hypothetical protein
LTMEFLLVALWPQIEADMAQEKRHEKTTTWLRMLTAMLVIALGGMLSAEEKLSQEAVELEVPGRGIIGEARLRAKRGMWPGNAGTRAWIREKQFIPWTTWTVRLR